jgi:RNA polymerase sigma-70 factor (ECF subfamily)
VVTFDENTPEAELIDACRDIQRDDFDEAFAELYRRYRDRVYSIGFRMMGNAVDAMDVVQDSFRVLFLKLSSFRNDAKFSTWLFRIVVNCSIDLQRREAARSQGRTASLSNLEIVDEPSDHNADPLTMAADSELGEHVHRALARLSPKLRAVLVLRYLEGMSYEQLAETLEIQLGTVKSRMARAHIALEGVLSGTLEQFDYPAAPGSSADSSSTGSSPTGSSCADDDSTGLSPVRDAEGS